MSLRLHLWRVVLVITAFAPAFPSAQAPLPAAAAAKIDAVVRAEQERQSIPGISVAVAIRNELVYSQGFGKADLQHDVPVKATTAFRTASVAKPITATGVMTLVEAGKIDLDAPVRTYCAAWPEKHPTITPRQLLGHLAGVRHYNKPGESSGKTHFFSIGDSLALFKNDPLLHEPGSKYFYTTFGYSLLGCAIEGASGTTYEHYMRERVFAAAGMTRTRLDRMYEIIPDRAAGYEKLSEETFKQLPPAMKSIAKAGGIYNATLHDTSMKIPGGGLVSTAEDLVRFGIALNTAKLLKKPAIELMWTEQKTTAGEGTGYGMGFGVTPPVEGVRRLSHTGNQAGASSALVILPEVGVTYAIMANLEDVEIGPISRGIAGVLRDVLRPKLP